MTRSRTIAFAALALAIAAGTIADRPLDRPPLTIGGYRVLAADFHTHSSMWSDGTLTPWGLVMEAERQGLDAIAITGHDQTIGAYIGRWFSRRVGGPTVLVGEEMLAEGGLHLIAAGITDTIRYRRSGASAIDNIHRQGGVAIVAHPFRDYWRGYDEAAMQNLDGAEICHPGIYVLETGQRDLEQFAARAPVAAIGSSDAHGLGVMGLCRTYVFATDESERAIVDAVRAHRTVVFGEGGRAYGDPALLQYANRLRDRSPDYDSRGGVLDWFSRIAGVAGLAGLFALHSATSDLNSRP
jgi:predicted metal-dependent phosphoesterase TrpH